MISLLPEPKIKRDDNAFSKIFGKICFESIAENIDADLLLEIAKLRFWNFHELDICTGSGDC